MKRKRIGSKSGRLLVVFRFEIGIPTTTIKEVLESLIEVSELLLEGHRRDFTEPRLLLLELRETFCRVGICQALPLLIVGVGSKLQGPVPYISGVPEDFGENRLLPVCRVELIFESFLSSHTTYRNTYSLCKF